MLYKNKTQTVHNATHHFAHTNTQTQKNSAIYDECAICKEWMQRLIVKCLDSIQCLWAMFNLQRLLSWVIAHSAATGKHKLYSMYPSWCCDSFVSHWPLHMEFVRWCICFPESFNQKFSGQKSGKCRDSDHWTWGSGWNVPGLDVQKVTVSRDCD